MALGRRLGSPVLKEEEDPLVEEQEDNDEGEDGEGEGVGVGGSKREEEGRIVRGRGVTNWGKTGWN